MQKSREEWRTFLFCIKI